MLSHHCKKLSWQCFSNLTHIRVTGELDKIRMLIPGPYVSEPPKFRFALCSQPPKAQRKTLENSWLWPQSVQGWPISPRLYHMKANTIAFLAMGLSAHHPSDSRLCSCALAWRRAQQPQAGLRFCFVARQMHIFDLWSHIVGHWNECLLVFHSSITNASIQLQLRS